MNRVLAQLTLAAALTAPAHFASAHYPLDLPGPAPTLERAVPLPSAQTTWVIYGILSGGTTPEFIRLDNLDNDQEVSFTLQVFTKPAYAAFAPTMALVAPGLPQPTETLPFALTAGYGALVTPFEGDPSKRPVSAFGVRAWWVGQTIEVPDLNGGPAYIAAWDPNGTSAEYTVVYNIEPDVEDPAFAGQYTNPAAGDGNDDGKVDLADATLALQMVVGNISITPRRLRALDVFPPKEGATMNGDGRITVPDVLRILRRAIGEEGDPFP